MLVLSNDGPSLAKARKLVAGLTTDKLTQRENGHLRALELALNNQWPSAVAVLDRHLMEDPHDLIGHQCALRLDGYQGDFIAKQEERRGRFLSGQKKIRIMGSCFLFMALVLRS